MGKSAKEVILIVDDKPGNILALEALLAGRERLLLTATNGREALKTTLSREVDLVILDVHMPDMDGFEVAQILKSNHRTRDIPIIFATAENREHTSMMKGYEEGAVDYLYKPVDPDVVRAKVSVLLKIQMQKKELLEKNASLQNKALLINNSADIIGIVDARSLRIEEVNAAFTSILGYPIDEAADVLLPSFLVEEDRDIVLKLAQSGQERLSFETRIRARDRSIKWLQWNVVCKDQKWFVNARDITEEKQVERVRNYLATVVKQSNDAIYIHDGEGNIISWNYGAEKIYGYKEHEALQMKVWNIVPDYLQPETGGIMNELFAGKKFQDRPTKRITKHGKLIDVLFSAAVITQAGQEPQTVAITERDVTQQKIADEQIRQLNEDLQSNVSQLEATNKELESFSYSVSHDLRAPLRALNGYSSMLVEEHAQTLDSEARRLLGNIQTNARKMGMLVDDLLAFSRLGRQEVQTSQLNMRDLVDEVVAELQRSVPLPVRMEVAPLPDARADYSLLRQVWMNLISNAIKYSSKKEAPQVVVGFEDLDRETMYFVKDNGAGFDMNYVDKLFGVFQRLHSPNEFEGTGIGLAIVQRVVTKHGGRVWAEGKAGEGATFFFTLPKSWKGEKP